MNLSTEYLGFKLTSPLVVGASPLADDLDQVKRLEDAGAAAIVMRSLFEEQLSAESMATLQATDMHAESFGEALSFFPTVDEFVLGPDEYLEQIRKLKKAVGIPVIASLNGATPGGWLDYSRKMAEAGADALELNLYYVAADPKEPGEAIQKRKVEMVGAVKKAVQIPVAVKISPFYTSISNFAQKLAEVGADGVVIFNHLYEPDIDEEKLEVVPALVPSQSSTLLVRLRWLAILSERVNLSLAATGGVHTAWDALKAVMCGAHAVQMVSALLKGGPEHLQAVRQGMSDWLEKNEYESLAQAQGSMNLVKCPDPSAFQRANYMRLLQTWRP